MTTQKISVVALFITLSIIGAYIKIPAIIGSVALDIFPALLAAVLIGGRTGALVASFGHLISAMIVGLPLGPMHAMIAVEMAIIVWVFGKLYRSHKKVTAGILFILLNGLITPLPFAFIISQAFFISLVPSLLIGSTLNVGITYIILPKMENLFATRVAKIWQ